TPPDITVLSPNGGEVWDLGSQHEITWIASSSNGIESVEILFYYADTAEYLTLETENDGAYTWTLPASSSFITKTGKIKIETIDANGNRAEDWSDGYFALRDPSLPPPPPWTVPERLTIVPPDDIPVKNHETPVLAVDNDGIVHLVYKYTQDDLGIEANKRVITQQILYKKLVGSSWSNAETVYTLIQEIDVGGDWHNIMDLQMAVDSSGNPHIVWLQGPGGIGAITNINLDEVYYACRNTSEWSLPLNISNNSNVSREPRITIEPSDNIHIVWIDGYTKNPEQGISGQPNIYYKKKVNITGSWSVTSQITEGGALSPNIAADGTGNLHLVFTSSDSENIYYKKWDGSSWLNTATVVIGGSYDSLNIVSDTSSHLHMVCYDYSKDEEDNYQQRILYSYYDGNAWSVPEEVSDRISGSNPNYPSIVTDSSDRPHVIWEDHSNSSIFYKRKHIFGWSNRVKLNLDSQHPEENSSCMTISDNDHAYVAWTNYYNGHSEVFYNHADVSEDTIPPEASLAAPARGEILSIGSNYDITWNSLDNVGITIVTLEYIIDDNLAAAVPVVTGISDEGFYTWTVPNIVSNKVQIRITVSDASGNTGFDITDYFSISDRTRPIVSVMSPNGGEVWATGDQQNVTWEAQDNVGISSINILYSIDEGLTWTLIADDQSNSGSYSWIVPDKPASTYKVKVIALDAENNQREDSSDSTFTVISANNLPNMPSSPFPEDEELNASVNVNLSWISGDPDMGDNVTYDVYFDTNSDPSLVISNYTGTIYEPGSLYYQRFYFWKIVANDSHGLSISSPVWSFLTKPKPTPIPPST
ncbi:MAG: Ig-like domain-containing protein, partial [Chloroflexi bacterium]|nr:Ig-like domain-containing protein [Chloroflexota bacterium]